MYHCAFSFPAFVGQPVFFSIMKLQPVLDIKYSHTSALFARFYWFRFQNMFQKECESLWAGAVSPEEFAQRVDEQAAPILSK